MLESHIRIAVLLHCNEHLMGKALYVLIQLLFTFLICIDYLLKLIYLLLVKILRFQFFGKGDNHCL